MSGKGDEPSGNCEAPCLRQAWQVTVSIPASLLADCPAESIILRVADPHALACSFREQDIARIACIQIHDLTTDLRPLIEWKQAVAVDVVVSDPDAALRHLYRVADLVQSCPVRVSVPVCHGFLKTVRLAASLHCAVKLQAGQPGPPVVDELLDALDFYLHGTGVTEPIEFFDTAFMAFFYGLPFSLWDVQEENPASFRYLTDDGRMTPPGRLARLPLEDVLTADGECNVEYLSAHTACSQCPYRQACAGYFKWPDPNYDCNGVRRIFEHIFSASGNLKEDLAAHDRARKVDGRE